MSDSGDDLAKLLSIFSAAAILALGIVLIIDKVNEPQREREAAEFIKTLTANHCKVSGVWGRSGEYRVWSCDRGIYKEYDNKLERVG